MCCEIAIKIENVSKTYRIYEQPHHRLKQLFFNKFRQFFGRRIKNYFREFEALKDISFEIKKGETIGVIGKNGSGKSTLLQMICGTLTPSNGVITKNGRIAALLELGSGFNPEFTGRENVYINASIYGLSKLEIEEKFKKIENFAEIGEFIDQPVKTYSSGMMVRLAFAVIAHVDADILVVDEALSVGDTFFTQKCMHFLRTFMKKGTVLFVSHDLAAVKNLCSRAVLLDAGTVSMIGNPENVCNAYYQREMQETYGDKVTINPYNHSNHLDEKEENTDGRYTVLDYGTRASGVNNIARASGWNTGVCDIISAEMKKLSDNGDAEFEGGEWVRINITVQANQNFSNPILGFIVKDRLGQELFGENTIPVTESTFVDIVAGEILKAEFVFRLPALQNGQYVVMVSLAEGNTENHIHHHYIYDAILINVFSSIIRFGIVGVPFKKISLSIGDRSTFESTRHEK